MSSLERAERRIAEVIAGSGVPEDPTHSRNTLEWLLRLDPRADRALRLAALGHDIERAVEERKVRRADFAEYDAFKAAHARNSAAMLREILSECGVGDEGLTREIERLVCAHEVGGDPRSDLLKDADSLSYFDVNLPLYYERHGWEETRRRCVWGYRRLSKPARSIAADLAYPGDELKRLIAESLWEVHAREKAKRSTRNGTERALLERQSRARDRDGAVLPELRGDREREDPGANVLRGEPREEAPGTKFLLPRLRRTTHPGKMSALTKDERWLHPEESVPCATDPRPDLALTGTRMHRVPRSRLPARPPARGARATKGEATRPARRHRRNRFMKIRPLQDRIIVRRIDEEETTKGGIIIPDSAKEKPQEGKVIAAGKGKVMDDGKLQKLDVKKGDRVLFGKYSGTEITIEGEEHIIIREDDVLGIVE
jgi:chaperonin GroES